MSELQLQTSSSITDWISALSSLASVAAVIIGLFLAIKQIGLWKTEARERRRAEIAEDILAAAHSVVDVMNSVRSPMTSIPVEELKNKTYVFQQKGKQLNERGSVFESLRHAQIRARAILRDNIVDAAIEKIFAARTEFWVALELAIDYADTELRDLESEDAKLYKETRRKIFGSFGSKDELHQVMQDALKVLDENLGPIIRIEV